MVNAKQLLCKISYEKNIFKGYVLLFFVLVSLLSCLSIHFTLQVIEQKQLETFTKINTNSSTAKSFNNSAFLFELMTTGKDGLCLENKTMLKCNCSSAFYGLTCQHFFLCTHQSCLNKGTCVKCTLTNKTCCECQPGTTGKNVMR